MSDLERVIARFCEAWNAHDAGTLAEMWSEDGELNHPWGFRAVGREAVRRLLEQEHAGSMAGSTLTVVKVAASGDDDRCIADLDAVLTGVRAPHGRAYDLQPLMSTMFVRSGGEWLIRSMTPLPKTRRDPEPASG